VRLPRDSRSKKYVDRLVRAEQKAEEELERLILAGIDSGPAFEPDEQYWQGKRRRPLDRRDESR
jgi:hypothetical protein